MVNRDKILNLLNSLHTSVLQLNQIAKTDQAVFLQDPLISGAAKYYLQTAIETWIDIGNHIISSEHYQAPKDYRDVFTILQENKVIPSQLATNLRQAAGLRNRLVHLYWEIEDHLIYEYLATNISDCDEYISAISKFINTEI